MKLNVELSMDKKNGLMIRGVKDAAFDIDSDIKSTLIKFYRQLNLEYSKFFKMDNLSKLAFIGTEIIKSHHDFSVYNDDEVALVFHNHSSSLDSDKHHQNNIVNGQVSPAIFVYTLPNILMGELAIRNKWFGENLFLIKETYDREVLMEDAKLYLQMKKAKSVLLGWVDVLDEFWELRMFLITNE